MVRIKWRISLIRLAARALLFSLALGLLLTGLGFIVLQSDPPVYPTTPADAESVARLRNIAKDIVYNLRRPGIDAKLILLPTDLTAATQMIRHAKPELYTFANLSDDAINIQATLPIDTLFGQRYINLGTTIIWNENSLNFEGTFCGALPIPGVFIKYVAEQILDHHLGKGANRDLQAILQNVDISTQHILVNYKSSIAVAGLVERPFSRSAFGAVSDAFVDHYADVIWNEFKHNRQNPELAHLLNILFEQAAKRSITSDPIMENRALLFALATSIGHVSFRRIAGMSRAQAHKSAQINGQFLLGNRQDLARHFTLAAGLEAALGEEWSESAGIYKEVSDSWNGGSGFSFADLVADQAGIHLARVALNSPESARRTQRVFARALETDFFPLIESEQENISSTEFSALYGNVDTQKFHTEKARIDESLRALPGFQAISSDF